MRKDRNVSIFLYSNNCEEGKKIEEVIEGQRYQNIKVSVISTQKISWLFDGYERLNIAERTRVETKELKECIKFSKDINNETKDYYIVNFNRDFEVKLNDKMISVYSEIMKNEAANSEELIAYNGVYEDYIKKYLTKKAHEYKEKTLKARSILYMDVYHEGHFSMYTYQLNGIISKKNKLTNGKSILEIFIPIKKNKNKEQKSFFELNTEEKKYFNSKEKAIEVLLTEITNNI